jgi:hypothetical protein
MVAKRRVGAGLGVVKREREAEGGVAVDASADWVGQARQILQLTDVL